MGAGAGTSTPDAAAAISIQQHISISANLGMLADRLPLPKLVSLAMERTIAEIITPVVERSVTIACMTTQELILKVILLASLLQTEATACAKSASKT